MKTLIYWEDVEAPSTNGWHLVVTSEDNPSFEVRLDYYEWDDILLSVAEYGSLILPPNEVEISPDDPDRLAEVLKAAGGEAVED